MGHQFPEQKIYRPIYQIVACITAAACDMTKSTTNDWHFCSVIILQLNVNGIMVRGSVSEEFREMCHARRIAVFDRVPYKVLQGMSESCLVEPTIYVNEATEVG